jgi:hypothetical protein
MSQCIRYSNTSKNLSLVRKIISCKPCIVELHKVMKNLPAERRQRILTAYL